ncbi:undecaprenyl diphosphate synthase [Salinarchaeum sp. Harcht-Bsk1]|uniref:undecaprenyl diphosphate synthase family protein n=1 Tax=Salinarchaeum sp. Harcht-Bsk1 TaxID=1333523 RepID=UPI0003422841|nr:undecaprenyl diphosphate synthase family protein [Salinarchaeum sp. Harcht-Bsk1]AGN01942.1 undecaprenyl diphosphate synthase [Salinarchaeum sp. Harcht-Bsk1]
MGLYDRYLALRVRASDAEPPEHVALVITERDLLEPGAYETLSTFLEWAFAYGAERVTVYVSVLDPEAIEALRRGLDAVDAPRAMAVHGPDESADERATSNAPIQVSVGLGGKHEFTQAVRSLAEAAAAGDLDPTTIDEGDIEAELVLSEEPDLVIKTGAERLSDFMIWQSVYSELYFTDVNWRDLRKRDYLRALREYADRSRRFGR